MKKKEIKALSIPAIIILILTVWCNWGDWGKGIVSVPDWEHGVALCEGGEDERIGLYGEAHMWKSHGIMFVVNKGHMVDDQLMDLKTLATAECAQYLNN